MNVKEVQTIRLTLSELGHPQPPTPIHCDNNTAADIAKGTIKTKWSRSMGMRYFYHCNQVIHKQYDVIWHPGQEKLGDYTINIALHSSTCKYVPYTCRWRTYDDSFQKWWHLVICEGVLRKPQGDTYGDASSPVSLTSDRRFYVYLNPPNGQTTSARNTTSYHKAPIVRMEEVRVVKAIRPYQALNAKHM